MTTPDSDQDPTKAEPSFVQWQLFEKEVRDSLRRLDKHATVAWNHSTVGLISGTPRQIDVYATGTIAGQAFVIAVECKHYKRPLGIGAVDEFAGKLQDIGADRGIVYGLNGLTEPAQLRATGAVQPRIAVGELVLGPNHIPVDIEPLLKFGDCPNPNCIAGDISWETWRASDGQTLEVGVCSLCGTWSTRCPEPNCGEVQAFVNDDESCYCGTRLSLDRDNDYVDVVAVEAIVAGQPPRTYHR